MSKGPILTVRQASCHHQQQRSHSKSEQPSISKIKSRLDGSDSDIRVANSSTMLTNKNGGASLSPFKSNASDAVGHRDCYGAQSQSTRHLNSSGQCPRMPSCSLCNLGDHVCVIQHGGLEEPKDASFDVCDESIEQEDVLPSNKNFVINLAQVSSIDLYYHHT